MTLSDISIRHPVFAWMLMASFIVMGGLGFQRMGVSQLPDVDFPVVSISVDLEGASPEVMEIDVVDPIENALTSVEGIIGISSSSKTGTASISVEFNLDKNIDVAVQEIQSALGQAIRQLPREVEAPIVRKNNPENQPILWLAVTADSLSQKDLMTLVRDRVKDQFSTLTGVGEVFLGGYVEPALRVWLSNRKLNQHDLTASDILNTIQAEHAELPAGRIESQLQEMNVRTMGEAPTAEEFSRLTISRRGGGPNFRPIALQEVAEVEDGLSDIRRKSRSMGKTAVGLGIRKQPGSNAVEVAHEVKERMKLVAQQLPEGVSLSVQFDATKFIEEAVHELNFTLILSAILTALVCWAFLGSWSATLNVILAIPTSIIGSFFVLYALNFTLNTFTLLGLSLAIGIVVDDAIMVLENIVRHFEKSKNRFEAASEGAREITFAAVAATAAIIAIFLPVAFMEGIIGKFFYQFGVTLSVAVFLSLIEALTLTPMRCSRFLTLSEKRGRISRLVEALFHWASDRYEKIVPVILNHRWKTLGVAFAIFGASCLFLLVLKKEFVPAQDQGSLMVRIQTPIGSSLDYTDDLFKQIEKYLMAQPEVSTYFGAIGGFGGGEVNTGMIFLSLKTPAERPKDTKLGRALTQQEIADKYRKEFRKYKEIKATIQDPSQAGFGARRGFPIEFSIRGTDWDTLVTQSKKMMAEMEKSGMMVDVDSDYREGMPEVRVVPDREKAKQRGVTIYDIAQTINMMVGGVVAGKYSKGGHRYDVRLRLAPEDRSKPEDVKSLYVRNNRGELIPLSDLVRIESKPSLQGISRQDRSRAISIYSSVSPKSSQAEAIKKINELSKKLLPPGYYTVMGGSAKTFQESFRSLIFALILGIIIAYMVLASQFNSFIHPLTVLTALPFSVTGAFLALYLGGQTLNIYSMIGILLLLGIVKKNSILLIDLTNQLRTAGKNVSEALKVACPQRLRPILMTSAATIAGAIPPAIALGPGAESRIPMAITIIGGMILSTGMTLFVVPAMYSLFSKSERHETVS